MKIFRSLLVISILGALSYCAGMAYGTSVTKIMGGHVTYAVDPVTLCPDGDNQLSVEYTDTTLTTTYKHSFCLGAECMFGYASSSTFGSSFETDCPLPLGSLAENCASNTILNQLVNAQRFNGDSRTFRDISVSNSSDLGGQCSLWLGPGATNPVTASCTVVASIRGTDWYGDGIFYVADLMDGTFGPKAISLCGIPLNKTTDSDNCIQHTGDNNHGYSSIAINTSTNKLFLNHGSFSDEISRFDLDPLTGEVLSLDATTGAGALSYGQTPNTAAIEMMELVEGGSIYVLRRDTTPTPDTGRVLVWDQGLSIEEDDYVLEVADGNLTALKYSPIENALYACGVTSTAGKKVMAKFSLDGTILATLDAADVAGCYDIEINPDTGRVYISVNNTITVPKVHEVDQDTLAILRSVNLAATSSGSIGYHITIDEVNEKIYAGSVLSATAGEIVRIDTCGSI